MRLTPRQLGMMTAAATAPDGEIQVASLSAAGRTCDSLLIRELLTRGASGRPGWFQLTDVGRAEHNRRIACSFPGCGKPTGYLPHADGGPGWGWRHLDPADEVDSHVGYPMRRGSAQ